MSDPRNNADDAYAAFMSMPADEWSGLLLSLVSGGVLTPAEQEGFVRASEDRVRRPVTWAQAFVAAMTERGYPEATLDLHPGIVIDGNGVGQGFTYSWSAVTTTEQTDDEAHEAWETAHQVFVEIDHLRPSNIPPSPALRRRLDG